MEEDPVRWNIKVSKSTDVAVRTLLAQKGLKKGDLSKFIEDAVKWRLFNQTVDEVREAFVDVPTDELHNIIDEAVASVRNEKYRERQSRMKR